MSLFSRCAAFSWLTVTAYLIGITWRGCGVAWRRDDDDGCIDGRMCGVDG